jgi:hypothetical protein
MLRCCYLPLVLAPPRVGLACEIQLPRNAFQGTWPAVGFSVLQKTDQSLSLHGGASDCENEVVLSLSKGLKICGAANSCFLRLTDAGL